MNAICLVIDRLHRGLLGPYGNTWLETPALNRLAAQGFTFDQALINSPQLPDFYAGVWQGVHPLAAPLQAASVAEPRRHLLAALHDRGVATTLVTDDAEVAGLPLATVDDLVRMPLRPPGKVADSVDETALAALFGQAAECLESARGPYLLWVHAAGLSTTWDAPLALRNGLVDDDEPLPPQTAEPPAWELPVGFDPDQLLGWRRAYAGQVLTLDELLDGLMAVVDQRSDAAETLLMILSPRGYALGEHRRVGPFDGPLYSELVHVPWLIRLPVNAAGVGCGRTQALVQPADVGATLAEWFGLDDWGPAWDARSLLSLMREDAAWPRDRVAMSGPDGQRALRTAHWHLRQAGQSSGAGTSGPELFAKPDDLWDQNEVAARCVEAAEQLAQALAAYEISASTSPFIPPAPLTEIAASGFR